MAARVCAACGTPVLDATDTYCGNCGSPLARPTPRSAPVAAPPAMAPSEPGKAPRITAPPAVASGARYPPAVPAAPGGLPRSPSPLGAAMDAPGSLKSVGLALLLEVLVPGAGALYAGQAGQGIAWLAGTVAGFVLEAIALESMHPLRSSIIGVSYLAWLVVRCVLISDRVQSRNAQVRRDPPPPLCGTSGATGVTLGVIVVALLLGSLDYSAERAGGAAFSPFAYWGWVVIAAYWVALCRLPRAGAMRVCAETIGWNLVLFFVVDMALVLMRDALAARSYPLARARQVFLLHDLGAGQVSVEVIVASLLGVAFALIFARWPAVRARRSEQRSERSAAGAVTLALVVTGVFTLGYVAVLLPLVARAVAPRQVFLASLWAIGVPLLTWTALPWYAAWRALRLLRASDAPAHPTTPPVPVPTPASPPAFWPR